MSVRKITAAARALFDLEAAHSSESETESDTESECAFDRAFIDVDAVFGSSDEPGDESSVVKKIAAPFDPCGCRRCHWVPPKGTGSVL